MLDSELYKIVSNVASYVDESLTFSVVESLIPVNPQWWCAYSTRAFMESQNPEKLVLISEKD
jgi:hypothetical protein